MPRSPYDLPAMTMLRAFEAAARHEAFKEAAAELNVTPGAISHQVKALERDLGLRLFRRGHRRVDLTEEGRQLYDVLRRGLRDWSQAIDRLRRQADRAGADITATTAVSHLWLTPRLVAFWKEHGDMEVHQSVSDAPPRRPLMTELAIEYRTTPPEDALCLRLFGDVLVPAVAPGYAAPESLVELAGLPLIHMDASDENWTTWARWFRDQGHEGPINLARRVNNYTIATQLAAESAGVVLGWQRLISPLIRSGRLVTLDRFARPAPGAFYLVGAEADLSPPARRLFDWMADQMS